MKDQRGIFSRISQLLSRGVGKQQIKMFYGQGGGDLRQEAWTRTILRESQRHDALLQTLLRELHYTSVDIETTGFHPEHGDAILSIGAIRVIGNEVAEEEMFSTYLHSAQSIPGHITALTGITDTMVVGAPLLKDVFASFELFLQNTIVIGYYLGHELKFFNHFLWRTARRRFTYRTLEMQKVAECLYPHLTGHRLEDMLKYAGISIDNRHNAESDARMTAKLWIFLQRELEDKGVKTLEDLYVYLANEGKR
jgi:DNA polymerase-3 subunit epsilon